VAVSFLLLQTTFEYLQACLVDGVNENFFQLRPLVFFNGEPTTVLLGFLRLFLHFEAELGDNVRVVRLNALDIILDLLLDVGLADSHVEYVLKESFKLGVLCEGTVDAVFVLCHFLTSLCDHHAVKHDVVCLFRSAIFTALPAIELGDGVAIYQVILPKQL